MIGKKAFYAEIRRYGPAGGDRHAPSRPRDPGTTALATWTSRPRGDAVPWQGVMAQARQSEGGALPPRTRRPEMAFIAAEPECVVLPRSANDALFGGSRLPVTYQGPQSRLDVVKVEVPPRSRRSAVDGR